jgi:hypothetical protein
MSGTCSPHGGDKNIQNGGGKTSRKLVRYSCRRYDNIKMNLTEIKREEMESNQVAQDMVQ